MVGLTGAAIIGAGASLLGSSKASKAAKKAAAEQSAAADRAAQMQQEAADKALAQQERMYQQGRADFMPYREAGLRALGRYERMQQGTLPMQQTPEYSFARNEGLRALGAQYGARGLGNSGARMKAALKYGSGLASSAFGNEMQRTGNLVNMGSGVAQNLANLGAGFGQNTANLMTNTANNVSNTQMQGANARASGYVGAGNAWQQGLSGFGNAIGTAAGYYANRPDNAVNFQWDFGG